MKAGAFSEAVKLSIWAREAGCCGMCGRNLWGQVGSYHHRRARGAGGSKAEDTGTVVNGVLICGDGVRGCHGYVEGHGSWALSTGYRVPQGCDPCLVPIWIARAGWVLLEPDGGYQECDDPHPDETRALEAVSKWLLEKAT